jgi:uncharacterized protein
MFVGREREITELNALIKAPAAKVAVVYGRRRIGKTSLISEAIGRNKAIVLEGLENASTKEQLAAFVSQLSRQLKGDYQDRGCKSWSEAFLLLEEALKGKPMVIVIDELQWMANYRGEMVRALKMVWDNYLSKAPGRTLILCGSIASFMTTKVIRSSAFYGRTDLIIHLQGFQLHETRRMLPQRGLTEVLDAQSFTGGVPKYLELLQGESSVLQAIGRQAFKAEGYFVDEYERLFTSHFGRNPEFERLVRALAAAPYGLSRRELALKADVPEGGWLTQLLYDLEAAGFIHSHHPFDKPAESRLIRYLLSDPWLSFYFAFLRPKLKAIKAQRDQDIFGMIRQSAAWRSWLGRAFELICMRHAERIAELLGFSGVQYDVGPWFRAPRKGLDGVQIDLAFGRADHVITLCEMKRQTAPLGKGIIAEMERKVVVLQTEFPRSTIQRVLVTDGPVSKDLKASGYFYRIITSEDLAK